MTERIAIVTGSARGIGAATARRLATDGMAVAVLDLDEAACAGTVKEIADAGGRALAVGADVSKSDQVNAAVERVAAELGAPKVLVNNAGVIRDNLLFKMTDDDWDTVLGVHLRGAFLMCRAVQKYMVEQRWGRIVNRSSSSALGNRGQVNYSAAKAGMQGFTKTLALELGKFGIFSKTTKLQLAQESIPLAVVHMGKEHLSNCGAVKGHTRTNSRMDAQGLRRIKFFDVDRGETVADREMHSFSRTLI